MNHDAIRHMKESTVKTPMKKPRFNYVLVYGPPASGKTRNSHGIRRLFGAHASLDAEEALCGLDAFTRDWIDGTTILILSTRPEIRHPEDKRRLLRCPTLNILAARALLGSRWVDAPPRRAVLSP